jgi:hypothetical protein
VQKVVSWIILLAPIGISHLTARSEHDDRRAGELGGDRPACLDAGAVGLTCVTDAELFALIEAGVGDASMITPPRSVSISACPMRPSTPTPRAGRISLRVLEHASRVLDGAGPKLRLTLGTSAAFSFPGAIRR